MRSIKAYFDRFPNANDVLDQSIREQTDFIRQNVDNVERSPEPFMEKFSLVISQR